MKNRRDLFHEHAAITVLIASAAALILWQSIAVAILTAALQAVFAWALDDLGGTT